MSITQCAEGFRRTMHTGVCLLPSFFMPWFGLDFLLGFNLTVPVSENKSALLDLLLELFVSVDLASHLLTMLESALVGNAGLYLLKQYLHAGLLCLSSGSTCFSRVIARHHLNSSVLNVTRAPIARRKEHPSVHSRQT